jgi:5-methylcytosine-specific restriction endonuclease McrA
MWDKHRSTEMNICMDCGAKVARKETKRCKPCSTFHRYGRPALPKYYECQECGKPKTTKDQRANPYCHACGCARRKGSPEEIKLKKNTGRAVRAAIHRSEGSKEGERTFDYLPYTVAELKEHLEAQFDDKMSWDNYGSYWHIDHIFPQSRLPFDSLDHPNFQKCWALNNLQPLEAKANQSKGAKIL